MNVKFGCKCVLQFRGVDKPDWTCSELRTPELPTCMQSAAGLATNAAGAVTAWRLHYYLCKKIHLQYSMKLHATTTTGMQGDELIYIHDPNYELELNCSQYSLMLSLSQ